MDAAGELLAGLLTASNEGVKLEANQNPLNQKMGPYWVHPWTQQARYCSSYRPHLAVRASSDRLQTTLHFIVLLVQRQGNPKWRNTVTCRVSNVGSDPSLVAIFDVLWLCCHGGLLLCIVDCQVGMKMRQSHAHRRVSQGDTEKAKVQSATTLLIHASAITYNAGKRFID